MIVKKLKLSQLNVDYLAEKSKEFRVEKTDLTRNKIQASEMFFDLLKEVSGSDFVHVASGGVVF